MNKKAKELDSTRPTTYHYSSIPESIDVYCGGIFKKGKKNGYARYQSLEDLIKIGEANIDKPYIMSEYAHAMGNGLGNMMEYVEVFEKYPSLIGGCLWDWVDQGLTKSVSGNKYCSAIENQEYANLECHTPGGEYYWAYGGDFKDKPNSGSFCLNGIVFPDLSSASKLDEVKKVYQYIEMNIIDTAKAEFSIRNKYLFTNLSEYALHWKLMENGMEVLSDELKGLDVEPGGKKGFYLPEIKKIINEKKEYILEFSLKTKKASLWAEQNFELAWEQFELTSYPCPEVQVSKGEINLREKDHLLYIQIGSNKVLFDKNMGEIKSVSRNNAVLLEDLSNAFWRAPIDNDQNIQRSWRKAGLDSVLSKVINVNVRKGIDYVSITVKKEHKAQGKECGFYTEEIYTIFGNGLIKLEVKIDPFGELPVTLPRIGYEARVPSEYSQVSWYGKGFGSSYVDRSEGMKTGIYSGDDESLFINYPVPQENGNRSEVRWMEMADKNDKGINVSGDQLLNFSVRKYTTENLTKARHPFNLKELPFSVLNIDMEQGPIGNRSCGPEALEKYWLKPDKKKYVIYIRGTSKNPC